MAKHKLLNSRHVYDLKHNGYSYNQLARKYGVSVTTIRYHIKKVDAEIAAARS